MKKLICILVVISAAFLCGCGTGTAQTRAEVNRQHKNVGSVGLKQLNDDLNSIFHADKPSRLTDRYTR